MADRKPARGTLDRFPSGDRMKALHFLGIFMFTLRWHEAESVVQFVATELFFKSATVVMVVAMVASVQFFFPGPSYIISSSPTDTVTVMYLAVSMVSVMLAHLVTTHPFDTDRSEWLSGEANKNRVKRAIAYDVVRGLRAVNVLLKGARKDPAVKSQGREINFIKKGDLQQAIMDFHSVLPVHVKTYRQPNEMYALVGYVGDRTLTMKYVKSERPTVTIFKTLDAHNPNLKRTIITYKRDSKVFDEASNYIHLE